MKVTVIIMLCLVLVGFTNALPVSRDAIVFVEERSDKDDVITPPVLPVIEHLERDPTTLKREDNEVIPKTKNIESNAPSPRFGFTGGFGVVPTNNGGFSASVSHGFSGAGGASQSGSHSINVGGLSQGGFQVSQSSSQSSSFGGNQGFLGPSLSGSQSSSQSSSFSGGLHGFQSASSGSSAGSTAGNIFGQGFSNSHAQSQSAANSIGIHGGSSAFGQGASQSGSFLGNSFSNGQSSSGAFGNGVASGSGFGFGQSGNGFSGSNAGSQSSAAVFQGMNRLPIPNRPPPSRPINFNPNFDIRGQREFGSSIVFPGPTNIKQRNPNFRPIYSELTPPNAVRNQQFRAVRRKPSTYQVIRIEV